MFLTCILIDLIHVVICLYLFSCAIHFDSVPFRPSFCIHSCPPRCCPAIFSWTSPVFAFLAPAYLASSWRHPSHHVFLNMWPYHRHRICLRKVVIGSLQMSSFLMWSLLVLLLPMSAFPSQSCEVFVSCFLTAQHSNPLALLCFF